MNIWNSKFYHPAKFKIKRIKTEKVFWNMAHLGVIIAKRGRDKIVVLGATSSATIFGKQISVAKFVE